MMGTNHLQNDVPEPVAFVAFASPFSSCILEGAGFPLLRQSSGAGRRVGYSFFPVFRSISCHLLMVWRWSPPILGAPSQVSSEVWSVGRVLEAGAQCFLIFPEVPGYLLLGTSPPQYFLWEQFSLPFQAANTDVGSCAPC